MFCGVYIYTFTLPSWKLFIQPEFDQYLCCIVISHPARRDTLFSLKLLQLHIFGKLLVLMNFDALQYFLGLVNFGLLLSE